MIIDADRRSRLAWQFFLASAAVFLVAGAGGWLLVRLQSGLPAGAFRFPPAFWFSTVLLVTVSASMQRAVRFVSIERQRPFRSHLIVALVAATLFVSVQISGMSMLLQSREPAPVSGDQPISVALGTKPYVFVAAALHAMHALVALLFLIYITLGGMADRYDHESYFPVRFCAWFWHALGLIWGAILCVFAIVLN